MKRTGRVRLGLLLVLVAAEHASAGAEAPPWLREAAAAALPEYGKKVPAVVLVDEGRLQVEASGRVRRTGRFAVKVLKRDGRAAAAMSVPYGTEARKVVSLEAWLVPASGEVKKYGKGETVDVALAADDVYNEARARGISARDDAEVGAVFGAEYVTEERPLFAQDIWPFQARFPVRLSRYTLELPAGWRAVGRVLNSAAEVAPTVTGSQYTWEMRDLPYVEDEPLSPPVTSLAPRLAVGFFPAQASPVSSMTAFASWADVSRWYTTLSDPPSAAGETLAATARDLTRDARTDLDKVRALARFVQGVNYIGVQIGIGRYRPHDPADVLAKRYGDCKDKASLMRALLKAVGLSAHLVLVYSGDPSFVRDEWPSPAQFNHCIVAVRLAEGDALGAMIVDPALGRLLFFDPTDPHTLLGDLPQAQQGSLALVAAGETGRLVQLPRLGSERNTFERRIEAKLADDGGLTASVREVSLGQAAALERGFFHGPRADLTQRLETWVTGSSAGARLTTFEPRDEPETGRFQLDLEMAAPRYGQIMQGRLLLFRPVVLSRREWTFPTGEARTQPVALDDETFSESIRFAIPEGFRVDELPSPVSIETGFGKYGFTGALNEGQLTFTRRLETRRATIPAAEYETVRGFFEKIRAAERSQAVLIRGR